MFRVGQKVVCVDDRESNLLGYWNGLELVKGRIYTISQTGLAHHLDPQQLPCVHVAEIDRESPFWAHRFRPVANRKTDISIFTAMLDRSKRRINVNA